MHQEALQANRSRWSEDQRILERTRSQSQSLACEHRCWEENEAEALHLSSILRLSESRPRLLAQDLRLTKVKDLGARSVSAPGPPAEGSCGSQRMLAFVLVESLNLPLVTGSKDRGLRWISRFG